MTPDLNALLIFARVVEAGGFSAAARQLRMPVSTVSRRVADLEVELGIRLLERSTRRLRLTDLGAAVLDQARRGAEISEAVIGLVLDQATHVSGVLRIAALPSLCDTLMAPLVGAFQAEHPDVRVQVIVIERHVDPVADGIDLVLRYGALADSALVARPVLTYRHQLVASPAYLAQAGAPRAPQDLHRHRLLAFSIGRPDHSWVLVGADERRETVSFQPHLTMNDYAGLAAALAAGAGIGGLPPVVQPQLMRAGRLVEVMPDWRFRTFDLSLVHLGHAHTPRPVRLFRDFAARTAPTLFPNLPV
ncbi:LysR family transcriptional regulator [Methylobacterium sp. J-070]|uniref:LysR family transcriptional regulator n=1 Tax=Methylobacterium sp. J-070 TaxID=2836650 RepID=UPI001FB95862|nr:LysR family transcriptional regulator [Methylobacterium sp. J-070]MCJ2052537.1 LysR family transcriptional regulator [Methylobacterium sp. J-070]